MIDVARVASVANPNPNPAHPPSPPAPAPPPPTRISRSIREAKPKRAKETNDEKKPLQGTTTKKQPAK